MPGHPHLPVSLPFATQRGDIYSFFYFIVLFFTFGHQPQDLAVQQGIASYPQRNFWLNPLYMKGI